MLLTPAQIERKSFESRRNYLFTRGGCVSCLRACLGVGLLPQSYQYPNLSEGADRVAGQLRGDEECPFSDVTKSGRVWRKVPENGARSVPPNPPPLVLPLPAAPQMVPQLLTRRRNRSLIPTRCQTTPSPSHSEHRSLLVLSFFSFLFLLPILLMITGNTIMIPCLLAKL